MTLPEHTQIRIKHTIYFIVGIVLAVILFWSESIRESIEQLGSLRYIGALLAGLFYSTSFGAASATVAFFEIGKHGNLPILAMIGGAGSLLYDYIIHRFAGDRFTHLLSRLFHKNLEDLFNQRHFIARLITLLGIVILASPLPDEIGASLLGLSRMRQMTFLFLSFVLNTVGIYIILLIGRSIG